MTSVKPTPYEKTLQLFEENEKDIQSIKAIYDQMKARQKLLRKSLQKIQNKINKGHHKPKQARKLCGFARLTLVSNDMCDFLKQPHGSEVSRTDVTKTLIGYIKANALQNPDNKRQILPDETLYKLFGEEARSKELTYFTMQKFVNHHFLVTPSATEEGNETTLNN